MGICTSTKTNKQSQIKENGLVQAPTKQLLLVNDSEQKQAELDKCISAILSPDITHQVDTFTSRPLKRTQTQIVEMKTNRSNFGKRQFRNIYTICNLGQYTQQNQNDQELPKFFIVQENQSGKIGELIIANKNDSEFLAQYIWIQNINKNNFHMCQVLDIFVEQKSVMIVIEKFNNGSFAQLIHQKELNISLTSELFLQMLDICQFMEENQLIMGLTNLESFEIDKIGNCYIVKYCNFKEYYYANQSTTTKNNNNIDQIVQISLKLLLKQKIIGRITNKNISQFMNNLPEQIISDELFQQFKNFLLKLDSNNMKQDIQTILNDPFIIQIREQIVQKQMLKIFKPILGKKLSYFQFCVIAYMIQEFQPEYAKLYLKLFQQIDQNKNGMISRDEFIQCQFNNQQQTNQENISEIFQNIDIGEDEQIDFQEFIVAMTDKQTILCKKNLKKTFQQLKNKNNTLTVRSLSKLVVADASKLNQELNDLGLKNLYYEDFERVMSTISIF